MLVINPWKLDGEVEKAQRIIPSNHVNNTKRELERKVSTHEQNCGKFWLQDPIDTLNKFFRKSNKDEDSKPKENNKSIQTSMVARSNYLNSILQNENNYKTGHWFDDVHWKTETNKLESQASKSPYDIRPLLESEITLIEILDDGKDNHDFQTEHEQDKSDPINEASIEIESEAVENNRASTTGTSKKDEIQPISLENGNVVLEAEDSSSLKTASNLSQEIPEAPTQTSNNQTTIKDQHSDQKPGFDLDEDLPEKCHPIDIFLLTDPADENYLHDKERNVLSILKRVRVGKDFYQFSKICLMLASKVKDSISKHDPVHGPMGKKKPASVSSVQGILRFLSQKFKMIMSAMLKEMTKKSLFWSCIQSQDYDVSKHIETYHHLPLAKACRTTATSGLLLVINIFKPREETVGTETETDDEDAGNWERKGNQVDEKNIVAAFGNRGYILYQGRVFNTQTRKDLINAIKSFANDKDHENFDSCAVVIMSHGYDDKIETPQGTTVTRAEIQNYLCSKILEPKLKLLIFNACRGTEEYLKPDQQSAQGMMKNLLVSQATVCNYASTRHIEEGSWYIQALCSVLDDKTKTQKKEIRSIFDEVDRKLATFSKKTAFGQTAIQTSQYKIIGGLDRPFYFT